MTKEVARGAFFGYEQETRIPIDCLYVGDPSHEHVGTGVPDRPERRALTAQEVARASKRADARAARAPGLMMRRFPVPEADAFLFAEQRPEWPIWSGNKPDVKTHRRMGHRARAKHVAPKRNRTNPEDVRRGLTPAELTRFQRQTGWDLNQAADHDGQDTDRPHFHLNVAKYLFPANARRLEAYEHDHTEMTKSRLKRHLYQDHDFPHYEPGVTVDAMNDDGEFTGTFVLQGVTISWDPSRTGLSRPVGDMHGHQAEVDESFYAKRLSSHPIGFQRIAEADVVCFALEGCLKEAALVSAGYATFSCPSVTLWNAPELPEFVRNHLAGKLVLIIPDSDAWENDQVIMQALLAKERLDFLGADAEIAVPLAEGLSPNDEGVVHYADGTVGPIDEPGGGVCKLHGKYIADKRGVDDYLADGGRLDDMIWMRREPGRDLPSWLKERDARMPSGRRPRSNRVEQDNVVLRWLAMHANAGGVSRAPLVTIGRYIRAELESLKGTRLTEASLYTDVSRAIHRLDEQYGALSGADTLPERRLQMDYDEWPGELRVHRDLWAVTEEQTVRELLKERRRAPA